METNENHTIRDCLVGVVTRDIDLRAFTDERWYRIPERVIGKVISREALEQAKALALYQSGTIRSGMPSAIEVWGEIAGFEQARRRDIVPEEQHHPRADNLYTVVRLKTVRRLESPIVSHRPRRITFLRSTQQRLFSARDVNDLIVGTQSEELLWERLRELDAERKVFMTVQDVVMEVDFSIFYGEKALGIVCGEGSEVRSREADEIPKAWSVLRFSPVQIEENCEECVREVMKLVEMMKEEGVEVPQL